MPRTASPSSRLARTLGLQGAASEFDIVKSIESRLPVSALRPLEAWFDASELNDLVIARRTLAHRKSRNERLTTEESDRVLRLTRITQLAEEVFGDQEKAGRWLRKGKAQFDGRAPIELLATEAGARLVEEALYRIEHGMAA